MVTLSLEQREELRKAGDTPIRIEDPETHATYVLLRADVYEGLKPQGHEVAGSTGLHPEVPEAYRRSKEAFLRDLPGLLARKRLRGRWALYRGDQRLGIWRSVRWMQRKIIKLGLRLDEYYANVIEPYEEPDEIETSLFEYDEIESSS